MSRNRFFVPRVDNKLGDRYELLECLGDGSYGWVWRAQRLRDNAVVAVKIPKEQGARNEDLAEGATLIGQARHPNIVNVYWMGRVPPEREWYVIEMEYFPSVTLAQLMDREEHGYVSSYRTVMNVFCQVLSGVEYLHSLGMSHGDIKPQNILVSGEQVKLTDFGCSTISEDIYCRTRENGGTILYSAPEIAGLGLGSHADSFRADIYSLGVLLYHFVTGRLPHDTPSQVVDQCLLEDGDNPRLMLRKASILGLQARYDEASKILLDLNRMHPRTPSVLKRLALVFEQIRDTGKAVAFLRAYLDEVPDDEWATEKLTRFSTIGLA